MRVALGTIAALAAATLAGACGDDDKVKAQPDSPYCIQIKAYRGKADELKSVLNNPSPDVVESSLTTLQTMVHGLRDAAPSQVRADLSTMTAAVDRAAEILEQYDWDLAKVQVSPEFDELQDQFTGDKVFSARTHFAGYVKDACGIDISPEGYV